MTEDEGRSTPAVDFDFENDKNAPAGARRAIDPLLSPDDPLTDDIRLVVSEFVSNVIQHTDDGGRLRAWDADPLRLEVHDATPALRVDRIGAGLRIVDRVADEWGGHLDVSGKTLWAEFRRSAR